MPSIDTDKLTVILNAVQRPTLKKLLEEKGKAQRAVEDATAHLAAIEAKLADTIPSELKGLLQPTKPKNISSNGDPKKPGLWELKEILNALPDKTLGIRQEGYDTKNIKTLVQAHPDLFVYEKGTWPKVRYLM